MLQLASKTLKNVFQNPKKVIFKTPRRLRPPSQQWLPSPPARRSITSSAFHSPISETPPFHLNHRFFFPHLFLQPNRESGVEVRIEEPEAVNVNGWFSRRHRKLGSGWDDGGGISIVFNVLDSVLVDKMELLKKLSVLDTVSVSTIERLRKLSLVGSLLSCKLWLGWLVMGDFVMESITILTAPEDH